MTLRYSPLFAAALFAGVSYCFADRPVAPGALHTAWKGAGVALLVLWAALNSRSTDGWLLVVVLAFGALGDVLLETNGLVIGAVAFLIGHLVAIGLYHRNRRAVTSGSQRALAALLLVATPLVAGLLTRDAGAVLYAAGLGAMAATAWLSCFPRYRVRTGAVLFVVSDWLIFGRTGGAVLPEISHLLVWPTYFAGQALIAWGVATTLAKEGR